jgi:uncharacterized membrane protein
MVYFSGADFVLWIHVLAACVWIGGQITLGMVMPMLRSTPDVMRDIARRFQNLVWAAFAILRARERVSYLAPPKWTGG